MKAIILNAGCGRRMLPFTKNTPKCLLDIGNGMTILEHQLLNLALCDIEDIVIVGGYCIDQLRAAVAECRLPDQRIRVVYHPHYAQYQNIFSLWNARDDLRGNLVIMNGDVVFDWRILWTLLNPKEERVVMTVAAKTWYDEEDMKVRMAGDRVAVITKQMASEDADAENIGMILFQHGGAEYFRTMLREVITGENGIEHFWPAVIQAMIDRGESVGTHDVHGRMWAELDFPHDLQTLRKDVHKLPPVNRYMLQMQQGIGLERQVV